MRYELSVGEPLLRYSARTDVLNSAYVDTHTHRDEAWLTGVLIQQHVCVDQEKIVPGIHHCIDILSEASCNNILRWEENTEFVDAATVNGLCVLANSFCSKRPVAMNKRLNQANILIKNSLL